MVISKDKGKQTFTITGVTLGKLLAIQNVFREYNRIMIGGMTPLKEEVLLEVNRAIEKESKKD